MYLISGESPPSNNGCAFVGLGGGREKRGEKERKRKRTRVSQDETGLEFSTGDLNDAGGVILFYISIRFYVSVFAHLLYMNVRFVLMASVKFFPRSIKAHKRAGS
jgi:hypothetical protein